MRSYLFSLITMLLVFCSTNVNSQDIPPAAANLELISADSYIIPLDEEKQSKFYTAPYSYIDFHSINLAAYGLVHELLSEGIEVKWVIRAGKNKDEADFTADVERVYPSALPIQNSAFRSSAFVIDQSEEYCNPNFPGGSVNVDNIISAFGNNVSVYKLVNDENLDVRYTLRTAPHISILSDYYYGGYSFDAFSPILDSARIDDYVIQSNDEFVGSSFCNTIVCQPHIEQFEVDQAYINVVSDFVQAGGNVFSQCVGVLAFENEGLFQSTSGFNDVSFNVVGPFTYYNADMPIMQFEGEFPSDFIGTTGSYELSGGSAFEPYAYENISTTLNTDYVSTSADVNGSDSGGNVFYSGGHDFSYGFNFITDSTDAKELTQSHRLYLNAVFVPAQVNFACAGVDVCICPQDSVQLGCPDLTDEIDFAWSPATGLSCTDCPRPMASPSETTTYTMSPIYGDCGESTVTVSILEGPSLSPPNILCDSIANTYVVSLNIDGATNPYLVSGNPGTITGTSYTSDPIPAGDIFDIQISDDSGCEVRIEGTQDCSCDVSALLSGGGNYCIDSGTAATVDISFGGIGPWDVLYSIDGVQQAPITTSDNPYNFDISESASIALISVSSDLCSGLATGTAEIVFSETGDASISPVDEILCSSANPIVLTPSEPNGTFTGPGIQGDNFFPAVAGQGIHTITYSITEPCPASESIQIEVSAEVCEEPCFLMGPNAFTPGEDGVNDLFALNTNCVYESFSLSIFNRWGERVFFTTDPEDSWNGTYREKALNSGVFVWIAQGWSLDGNKRTLKTEKGNITLIR